MAEEEREEGQEETRLALNEADFVSSPEQPSDLAMRIRNEQIRTVLEATRFPEVGWACNVIGSRDREPLDQKVNMMWYQGYVSSQGVATSYYSNEEDRRFIMGEISLLRALLQMTGYKDDISAQRTLELYLGDFAAEVQTRKGKQMMGARLLTTAITRVEDGRERGDGKPKGGILSRIFGGP